MRVLSSVALNGCGSHAIAVARGFLSPRLGGLWHSGQGEYRHGDALVGWSSTQSSLIHHSEYFRREVNFSTLGTYLRRHIFEDNNLVSPVVHVANSLVDNLTLAE